VLFEATNVLPGGDKSNLNTWLMMALFMLPVFLLFGGLFKEPTLKELEYSPDRIKRGGWWLSIYLILSFGLLILLILYKKGKL
jgi:hypothetical protein